MKIEPEKQNLEKVFQGHEVRYQIPDYQRDYAWKKENVEELWQDLRRSLDRACLRRAG